MAVRSGFLALGVVWLTAAVSRPVGSRSIVNRPNTSSRMAGPTVSALQLNLCDSGVARCFTGRSVGAAAAVIRDQRSTIVTLNEVCRGDVSVLRQAMSATGGASIVSAFKAAADRETDSPVRCRNGQPYGIGVLAAIPSSISGYRTYGGVYPTQDLADPEERVWLCIDVATEYFACTTHTASTSTTVALAQCRYLLRSAVPMMRIRRGDDPVILGADLNLPAGGVPGPQSCLPHGYQRVDDGSRQDIVASPGITLRSRTVIDMHGVTDHPGLFVELAK